MYETSTVIEVNGRHYHSPRIPTVVICVDGLDMTYLDEVLARGLAPFLASLRARGLFQAARSAMPSYTNPNNVSIVTGVPSAQHGIAGNYFYDQAAGTEVMMNDPAFLRAPTILSALAQHGSRVAVVTAKDKLRRMLAHGLPDSSSALCFSVEAPGPEADAFLPETRPTIYSAAASEAVFYAGLRLLKSWSPDFIYLSTTDYVQHKYAPGEAEGDDFVVMLDRYLAAMNAVGARLVMTADHGMRSKADANGRPNVVYLADQLDAALPSLSLRVILPITDPYVRHHGALGGFATIYADTPSSAADASLEAAYRFLSALPGVEKVLYREQAVAELELPADRIGDFVVLAAPEYVLGTRESEHDLSALERPLRSHGSLHEQRVPLITNFVLPHSRRTQGLRNFDAFAIALDQERGES